MLYRLFHLWAFFDSQAGIGATLWQFLKFPIIPHLCFHTARPTLGRFVPGYSLKGFPTAHLALNPVTAGACVRKANVMHDARCCSLRAVFPSVLGFWVKQCHVQTKRLASFHYSLCMVSTCPSVPKLRCWHVETSALHLDAALLCAALSRRQQKTTSEVQL